MIKIQINKYIKITLNIVVILLCLIVSISLINIKNIPNVSEYIDKIRNEVKIQVKSKDYEKAIKTLQDSFSKISEYQYNNYYEDIWSISSEIINIPKGRETLIDIFDKMQKSNKLSKDARLYITKRLKGLYVITENYAKSSEYIMKTIQAAIKSNDRYEEIKSKIELGLVYRIIGGHHSAIKIIEETLDVELKDKKENAYIKAYAYINLAEIYIEINDFDKAQQMCEYIPKYKTYFEYEDYRDIEILKNIVESKISTYNNDLDTSKEKLEYANLLINKDTKEFLADKDIEYLIAQAKYYYKSKDYYEAIKIYNNTLNLSKTRNKNIYIKSILYDLVKIAEKLNEYDLKDKYYESIIKIIEIEDSLRYRDYSYYIMEQNEKENLIIENMNRMKLIYTSILVSLSIIFIVVPIVYKKIKKIKYTSTHDGLTNVLNRLSLDKKYKSIIHKNQVVSIIMLDIDNFKNINDTYGHALGDRVLINVCKAITHMLSKDIELYRYGGEEFIVLARNKSEEEILELAENIRYYIEQIKWKENIKVTVSIGVAHSRNDNIHTIEKADENLYKAKKMGKNKVIY